MKHSLATNQHGWRYEIIEWNIFHIAIHVDLWPNKLCFIPLFHISIHVDLWPNFVSFYYFISPSMSICGQTMFHSIISYLHPCWFVAKLCFILLFHISIHVDLWPNYVSFYYFISPSMLICGQTMFHSISLATNRHGWRYEIIEWNTVWPQINMDGDMK